MKRPTALVLFAISTTQAFAAPGVFITSAEFGSQWPFMIDKGTLFCQTDSGAINVQLITFKDPAGNTYAVNGAASSRASKRGWFNVQSIWKANPAIPGTKIPITPIIQRGAVLCSP